MEDKAARPVVGEKYQHYNGIMYRVQAIATDPDNMQEWVICYQLRDPGKMWTIRVENFLMVVGKVDGNLIYRFMKMP